MSRFNGNYIEYPDRYAAATKARIFANANLTRRRALEAAIAQDAPEFRAWLFQLLPDALEQLRQASGQEFDDSDCSDAHGPAHQAYVNAWNAYRKATPELPTWLAEALTNWGGLTDKQLAFARKLWAEHATKMAKRDEADAARRATAQPWTAGRQIVTGEVKSTKITRNDFGESYKMLVQTLDGRKLWSSIPRVVVDTITNLDELKGTTVSIKVTVEPSKDDTTFAFGSRPNISK